MDLHKANLEAQNITLLGRDSNPGLAVASSHHQIPTASCSTTNAGLLPALAYQTQPQSHAQIKAAPQPTAGHALIANHPAYTAVTTNTVNGGVMSTSAGTAGVNPYLLNLYQNPAAAQITPDGLSMPNLVPFSAAANPQTQVPTQVPVSSAAAFAAAAQAAAAAAAAAYHVTPKLKSPSGLIAVSSGRGTDKFSPY